jgi:hypothetical protein
VVIKDQPESCGLGEVQFLRSVTAVPQLFSVRNSATDSEVSNIAELRECGLNLQISSFVYLWQKKKLSFLILLSLKK